MDQKDGGIAPFTMGCSRRNMLIGVASLVGTVAFRGANAQQPPYPSRPVTIIVPFAPGGSTDFVARLMAQYLPAAMGGTFVVDNRAGGSGTVGHGALARSRPDGYTLDVAPTGTFAMAPFLFERLPYDNEKAFAPIGLLAGNAMFVCVRKASEIRSYADLIAAAKAKPGQLSYASAGSGTVSQLAVELMLDMSGTDIVHVSYRSGALALQATLAGETTLAFVDTVTAIPYLQSGDLRPLAVTSAERNTQAREVPTLAECGLTGYRATNDFGFFAPAGTPAMIIERLAAASRSILLSPEMRGKLEASSIDPIAAPPDAFATYQADEARRWGALIRKRNIKPE
jgi:tripartite-type tricarboxylate transporter receptor subunit TctC